MDHLEHPTEEAWNKRREWFETLNDEVAGAGPYLVSEQACALLAEVQATFCAGAWLAVIILSMTVVDAQIRETESVTFKYNTKQLLTAVGADPRLQQLRKRRNALIHVDPDNAAITVDQQWYQRTQLESDARTAVRLMLEAFYMNPGV